MVVRRGGTRRRRRWKVEREEIELERTTAILEERFGTFGSRTGCYRSSDEKKKKHRSAQGKEGQRRRARSAQGREREGGRTGARVEDLVTAGKLVEAEVVHTDCIEEDNSPDELRLCILKGGKGWRARSMLEGRRTKLAADSVWSKSRPLGRRPADLDIVVNSFRKALVLLKGRHVDTDPRFRKKLRRLNSPASPTPRRLPPPRSRTSSNPTTQPTTGYLDSKHQRVV